MQVKIKSCSNPTYWYIKEIGSIFSADTPPKDSENINVKVPIAKSFVWRCVLIKDCELIK